MRSTWVKHIGPGPLVAAAFVGPGTVALCTLAGAAFGYALLWAMLLSIIATIVLQEMAARLGIISQQGLSEIIRNEVRSPAMKVVAIGLMLSAIVIGNAAYEAGNISGGVLGLTTVFGNVSVPVGDRPISVFPVAIGMIAFTLLYIGKYKVLERALIALVLLMSLAFLLTALITQPDLFAMLKGAFVPVFPPASTLTIVGLIGTTVVPYNLFLHASLVKEKWQHEGDLNHAKRDTVIAVVLGGIVSMSIIVSAAAVQTTTINDAVDLARGLEPLFGRFAKYFLAVGLFSAGITSAITAPLAAALVARGCWGWPSDMRTKKFRAVWMFILFLGVVFSSFSIQSIEIIKFAQVTNGILLPVVVGFLLWVVNKRSVLGRYRNSRGQNALGFIVLAVAIFLGVKSILKVFELL